MSIDDYTLVVRGDFVGRTVDGEPDEFTWQRGTIEFQFPAVVIPATLADIEAGTRSPTPPFDGWLGSQFDGSIEIHDTNNVILMPITGQAFGLGAGGQISWSYQAVGAFDNFAIWKDDTGAYIGKDPAKLTWIKASTQGTSSANKGSVWNRHHAVFIPPKNARYLVAGAQFQAVPTLKKQFLDAVQTEVLPLTASVPTAWQKARLLNVTVNPTRLNYSKNPGLKVDATGWSTSASGARDTLIFHLGVASYKVTGATANVTTVSHGSVDKLLPGVQYIASAYVRNPTSGLFDTRVSNVQTASASGTATFTWLSPYTGTVYFDSCLVERGTVVKGVFDGDSGADYLWEQGGVSGSCRSYFYEDRAARHYVLVRLLGENVPLGVPVDSPEYALRPPLS